MQISSLLFITSFIPAIVFKAIARMGEPTIGQAKIATAAGLTLAVTQVIISHRVLKESTYLEWAFLGFLATGAVWVFATPQSIAQFYVNYNTALLYFVLFLTTLAPQLLGHDPFTFTIAKRWQPEAVWSTPQFLTINLHITYMFSIIMFTAFLSNVLGQGKPLYAIVIPFALILGIGIPFARLYPKYYMSRNNPVLHQVDLTHFPDTVKELILNMPKNFNSRAAGSLKAQVQYIISGDGGGTFVLAIDNGTCTSREGTASKPDVTVKSPADIWMKISRGELNPPRALMDGLYSVEGDTGLLMNIRAIFSRQSE